MFRPPPEANLTVRGSEHCNLWPRFILETPHYPDKQYNLLLFLSCPCGIYLWRNFNKKSGLWNIRVIYRAAKGINRLQDKRRRKHNAAEDTILTAVLAIKPCYLFKWMTCREVVQINNKKKKPTKLAGLKEPDCSGPQSLSFLFTSLPPYLFWSTPRSDVILSNPKSVFTVIIYGLRLG